MNIGVHRFLWIGVSGFLGYIPSSKIAWSKAVPFLVFFWKFHTIFYHGCLNLHSCQQCTRVPFSPKTRQHLLFVFLIILNLIIVVLVCIIYVRQYAVALALIISFNIYENSIRKVLCLASFIKENKHQGFYECMYK